MSSETPTKTVTVALILCVVFSFLVSTTAVVLKDKISYNQEIDLKKNILLAAGLIEKGSVSAKQVEEAFKKVEPIVVDLESGEKTSLSPEDVNIKTDVKFSDKSTAIEPSNDVAGLGRRPKNATVYLVKEEGALQGVILPIVSKGLWSTMYGFLALAPDTKTVKGFGYYEQGETPGLGGEVDNPSWKNQWVGKEIFNTEWEPVFKLKKGSVSSSDEGKEHMVDGLSGATITSEGVTTSIQYWLSQNGFGPFLTKIRNGEY